MVQVLVYNTTLTMLQTLKNIIACAWIVFIELDEKNSFSRKTRNLQIEKKEH